MADTTIVDATTTTQSSGDEEPVTVRRRQTVVRSRQAHHFTVGDLVDLHDALVEAGAPYKATARIQTDANEWKRLIVEWSEDLEVPS